MASNPVNTVYLDWPQVLTSSKSGNTLHNEPRLIEMRFSIFTRWRIAVSRKIYFWFGVGCFTHIMAQNWLAAEPAHLEGELRR